MAKTILKTYDLLNIINQLFDNDNSQIQIIDEYANTTKTVKTTDFLNIKFFDYKYDIKDHNLLETEDGFQFPNLDNWLNSMGDNTKTYALVELINQEITSSVDIDMGSATAKITFLINQDKLYVLEDLANRLQREIIGVRNQLYNAEQNLLTCYYNILNFTYENEPITTALGRCIIASMEFNVAYLTSATTYKDLDITLSLDNTNYYDLLFNELKQDISFTGKANLMYNNPHASGTINTAVSYIQTFTFWAYNKERFIVDLKYKAKKLVDDNALIIGTINIPVWVKENVDYYNTNDNAYDTEEITTKMVLVDFTISVKNSDFVVCSITLNRFGKV